MLDVFECYLRSLRTQLAEGDGLLRGKVTDNEAIDAGFLAVVQQGLLSVGAQGVVVAHQQDRSPQPPFPSIANNLEGALEGDAVVQGDLVVLVSGGAGPLHACRFGFN